MNTTPDNIIPMEILLEPNPILRQVSLEVDLANEDLLELQMQLWSMHSAMLKHEGIGLAAVQVGILKRMIVIDLGDLDYELDQIGQGKDQGQGRSSPLFLINPVIVHRSKKIGTLEEGCLSVQDKLVNVSRPEKIDYMYFDLKGKKHTKRAEGLLAAAIQHEIDHLDGKLILDYL